MRGVWRLAAPCWPISALLVGVALLVPSGSAFAQSSLGAPLTSATGRSLADAVGQNENELIGREVLATIYPYFSACYIAGLTEKAPKKLRDVPVKFAANLHLRSSRPAVFCPPPRTRSIFTTC